MNPFFSATLRQLIKLNSLCLVSYALSIYVIRFPETFLCLLSSSDQSLTTVHMHWLSIQTNWHIFYIFVSLYSKYLAYFGVPTVRSASSRQMMSALAPQVRHSPTHDKTRPQHATSLALCSSYNTLLFKIVLHMCILLYVGGNVFEQANHPSSIMFRGSPCITTEVFRSDHCMQLWPFGAWPFSY